MSFWNKPLPLFVSSEQSWYHSAVFVTDFVINYIFFQGINTEFLLFSFLDETYSSLTKLKQN